jgi:5-methylcytosine-specific restriction endonuclease McrA
MSTFSIGEKTHQAVLPQRPALELAAADNPGVGTKRAVSAAPSGVAAGREHGRGEIHAGHLSRERHPRTGPDPVRGDAGSNASASTASPAVRIRPAYVPVLDKHGDPLMPCHPARARELLRKGRAVVAHVSPFVIRLKDRTIGDSEVDGVQVGIDPGSKHTGIAVFGFGNTTGEYRRGLFALQLDHRGSQISKNLTGRAQLRRGRRTRNLRYRAPRFLNRSRPKGWLAPSLRHRVEGVMSWTGKFQRWFPVVGWHQELVRFDMQLLENPEISSVEYQRGTLAGFEVREYLLAKWNRKCAYCDTSGAGPAGVPLNIDHINPRAKGGSDRVSNLTLACIPCNRRKGAQDVRMFLAVDTTRLDRVLRQAKRPLEDAAAVNSTRRALQEALAGTGLPVATGSGGLTKFNRTTNGLPKSHTLDALTVGTVAGVAFCPAQVHVARSTGRGKYQRTGTDKFGFPTRIFTSKKTHFGFATGDLVTATVPAGKFAGTHTGRVAVRARGRFVITTVAGKVEASHKTCVLSQRADGWQHTRQPEASKA